jgi:hypothetical protein
MGAPARWDRRPVDTTIDADAVQLETYRRLGGAERVAIAFRLTALVRETAAAGIRSRHPDYDEEKVRAALARLTLGDTLVRKAFPGRDLVDP